MPSELLDFFGVGIPTYIALTLLFSYLIWSKFLKNGKLKPIEVNDLLDIIIIFFFVIATLLGLLIFLQIIQGILNMYIDITKIWNITKTWLVPLFSFIVILVFINLYRNKKVSKKDLKKIFISIIKFELFLLTCFIAIYIAILLTALRYLFWDMILLLPFMIVFIMITFLLTDNALFQIDIKKIRLQKKIFKLLGVCFLIVIVITILFVPFVKEKEVIKDSYHIYGLSHRNRDTYSKVSLPIKVRTFGILGSLIEIIPVRYGYYSIETIEYGKYNFKIYVNSSKEKRLKELIGNYGKIEDFDKNPKNSFTDIILNKKKKFLVLKFNEKTIKNEDINEIIMQGYVKENISKFKYDSRTDAYDMNCESNRCSFNVKIKNNLDLPANQYNAIVLNLKNKGIKDTSDCKFIKGKVNFLYEDDSLEPLKHDCNSNTCRIGIYDNKSNEYIFEMSMFIEDDGVVRDSEIHFERPLQQVQGFFEIEC